jgi:hypothetical protein
MLNNIGGMTKYPMILPKFKTRGLLYIHRGPTHTMGVKTRGLLHIHRSPRHTMDGKHNCLANKSETEMHPKQITQVTFDNISSTLYTGCKKKLK